jgi:hypothetical protein
MVDFPHKLVRVKFYGASFGMNIFFQKSLFFEEMIINLEKTHFLSNKWVFKALAEHHKPSKTFFRKRLYKACPEKVSLFFCQVPSAKKIIMKFGFSGFYQVFFKTYKAKKNLWGF